MMKSIFSKGHRIAIIGLLLIACLFIGCGIDKAAQEEIINYYNVEVKELQELEDDVLSSYNSVVTENYTDDATMYEELSSNTIPLLNELQKKANSIEIENEELEEVHKIYIKYTRSFKNAVVSAMSAIEEQDSSIMLESNDYMYEAQDYADEYGKELKALCEKYNITIKE